MRTMPFFVNQTLASAPSTSSSITIHISLAVFKYCNPNSEEIFQIIFHPNILRTCPRIRPTLVRTRKLLWSCSSSQPWASEACLPSRRQLGSASLDLHLRKTGVEVGMTVSLKNRRSDPVLELTEMAQIPFTILVRRWRTTA